MQTTQNSEKKHIKLAPSGWLMTRHLSTPETAKHPNKSTQYHIKILSNKQVNSQRELWSPIYSRSVIDLAKINWKNISSEAIHPIRNLMKRKPTRHKEYLYSCYIYRTSRTFGHDRSLHSLRTRSICACYLCLETVSASLHIYRVGCWHRFGGL